MLNGHGDDIYKSNTEIKANFSTNVWYDADTDILRSMLITQIDKIFHYPGAALRIIRAGSCPVPQPATAKRDCRKRCH